MVSLDVSLGWNWSPLFGNLGLRSSNVLLLKLPVEVADIGGVQINQVDVGEAGEHQVFEQLAADAARSLYQHPAAGHRLGQLPGSPRDSAMVGRINVH
ncbi:hypothetical protein NN561_012304 [Cricetulus griseus]